MPGFRFCQDRNCSQSSNATHRGNERLFFEGDLQSLCADHHNSHTQQVERNGFIREIGIDGWPVDVANHPVYVAERKQRKAEEDEDDEDDEGDEGDRR